MATYDFIKFGTNGQLMPKGDRGSIQKLRSERRALEEQRTLYDDISQNPGLSPAQITFVNDTIRRIDRHIMVVEQLIMGGIELRQSGQGLCYKGKKHGFIRKISLMKL